MNRTLSLTGIFTTAFYLAGIAFLFSGRVDEIRLMAPNNIGDFLAGMFGPLAILWLKLSEPDVNSVIGFVEQFLLSKFSEG